jgi:hypothetical protein
MPGRFSLVPPVTVVALVAACSSSSAPASDSGAGGEAAVDAGGESGTNDATSDAPCAFSQGPCKAPDAFVNAEILPASSASCPFTSTQTWLEVGIPGATKPTTIVDGGQQNFVTVRVTCSVVPVGTGFDIALSILEQDANGYGLTIRSQAGVGAVTSAGASGIEVDWVSAKLSASQSDCTLQFTYGTLPVSSPTPVAAGRIWAHVSCPQAAFASDASIPPVCDGEVDFLFENCADQ